MYRLNLSNNQLEEIQETTFFENDLKERQHIEEWIRKTPEILEEELLIIGHEYDKFEVNERLDLLAIDKDGKLVIIEVKRDTTGGHVDFQALKYASYCSRLSPQDILEIYEDYIKTNGLRVEALEELMSFLDVEDEEGLNSIININQRIIIVAKEIDKRILSVCTWLYENNIDIKCVSIKPYKVDDQLIIDTNQIIPPDKLEDYYINKKAVLNERKIHINNEVSGFLEAVANYINNNTDYKVRYGGKRYYCVGGKFLDKPLNFIFGYSKRGNYLSIHLESNVQEGQELLKKLNEVYATDLSSKLKYEISLVRGTKNKELYKLVVIIKVDDNKSIKDYIQLYLDTFIKYKDFVETVINKSPIKTP
ncbi:hypothetical protein [Priestia megaterium]|uniref:hypothetical protein n=1 Tax=Priestia megaterium TaxID=1404 RepID=UPI0017854AA9|nr:hypothetical protein [Priestia megaterium]MBD8848413.1 hypothetical protein [Priestia megaterium]